jgi:hypothetical protein
MATLTHAAPGRPMTTFSGPQGLLAKYFYFAMSLLFAVIVVWGFSRTVNDSLFHPAIPRPLVLWFHAALFSGWVVFFIFQSALVRTRNVKWHRFFGGFGAVLGATMVPLGIATAIAMARFDSLQLHQPDTEAFLIVPLNDITTFGIFFTLAIVYRKKPELHRRLMFIATCLLLEAAFARFDFIFDHSFFPFCPDVLIALGAARDFLVNRRIHRVYLIAVPALILVQGVAVLTWRTEAALWMRIAQAILA